MLDAHNVRGTGARGSLSAGVVRSIGRTFAKMGGRSPGAKAVHSWSKIDLRGEPVRDYRCDRVARAGAQHVGGGSSNYDYSSNQGYHSFRTRNSADSGQGGLKQEGPFMFYAQVLHKVVFVRY